jgi:hypothetical protein
MQAPVSCRRRCHADAGVMPTPVSCRRRSASTTCLRAASECLDASIHWRDGSGTGEKSIIHRRPICVTGRDVQPIVANSRFEPHLHNEVRELVPQAQNGEGPKSADRPNGNPNHRHDEMNRQWAVLM